MRSRKRTSDIMHVKRVGGQRIRVWALIPVLMDALKLGYCLGINVVIFTFLHMLDHVAQRLPRPIIEVLRPFTTWLGVAH